MLPSGPADLARIPLCGSRGVPWGPGTAFAGIDPRVAAPVAARWEERPPIGGFDSGETCMRKSANETGRLAELHGCTSTDRETEAS